MFIEHVNLSVSDLTRSITFYRELFGLKVRWEGTTSNGAPAAHVGDDRSYLAFFQAAQAGKAEKDYGAVGLNHFGLVVDDLASVKERLASKGIDPHLEADYEPGRRLYFLDPDGVEVEVVAYDEPAR